MTFDPFAQPPRRPANPQARPTAGVKKPAVTEKEAKKQTRKKVLRFMFNPELGQSFDSMKQTHGMFMTLLANLFLQAGLIDATYAGLRNPKDLKLVTLIQTAYQGLEFTREGMPRVLIFAGFVGSMAVVVLSVLVFFVVAIGGSSTPPAPPAR